MMEGKGLCGWGWGEAILGRLYPIPTCGDMWAGSSVLLSSVAISFPKCGLCPTEAGWKGKQDPWQGFREKGLPRVQVLPHTGEDSCYLNPVIHKVI